MHWTQTPEGKLKMSRAQKKYARSAAGKRALAKRIKAAQAARHPKPILGTNGDDPAHTTRAQSGRAMLVDLARPEAARRIAQLRREIEKLTLFLDRTKS